MKKGFLLILVALSSLTYAGAAPTLYGLINKELRYVSQDKDAHKKNFGGVTDVDGFETRLGVKGKFDLEEMGAISYQLELGLNTARDNNGGAGSPETMRIRLAQINLHKSFGKITLGKAWMPDTLRTFALDPFKATGAQLLGFETTDMVGYKPKYLGFKARYFLDQVTYATPTFGGLAYSVTADRGENTSLDPDQAGEWYTHMLTYDKEFGGMKLNTHLVYAAENKMNYMTVGVKLSTKDFGVGLGFTSDDTGSQSTDDKDIKYTNLIASVYYNLSAKNTLALTYGSSDFGDFKGATMTGTQSQIAGGIVHTCSKNFKARLIVKNVARKTITEDIATLGKKENSALVAIAGFTVLF